MGAGPGDAALSSTLGLLEAGADRRAALMGLIMLDLDGTLIPDAIAEVEATGGGTKLERRQHELFTEPVLLPGRYECLKSAADEGDVFSIVTNQGGVAWGYHVQAEVYRRIFNTVAQLSGFWGRPFSVHVAFMHPRATVTGFKGDDGRKPSPLMLQLAMQQQAGAVCAAVDGALDLDLEVVKANSIMVGDRDEDREAAEAAGVDYVHPGDFFG